MGRLVFGASLLVVAVLAIWFDVTEGGNRIPGDGAARAAPARSADAPAASRPCDPVPLRRQAIEHVAEPAVVGFVTDEDGRAVAGAVVRADLCTRDDRVLLALGRGASDLDGRYSVALGVLQGWSEAACSGLSVMAEAEVAATGATAHDLQTLRCDGHGVTGMRLDLQLPEEVQRSLRGRVVDAAGRGVPAARVWSCDEDRRHEVVLRADATFRVALDDRRVVLEAHDPHAGWARVAVGGDDASEPVLVLQPCGASLRGTVRFADGTPARGLSVELVRRLDRNGQPDVACDGYASDVHVHTDGNGVVTACGLAEGWWLVAVADGAGAAHVGGGTRTNAEADGELVRTGAQPFAIELSASRVVLDVVDGDGRAIHGGELSALIWKEPDDAARAAAVLAGARKPDEDFADAAGEDRAHDTSSLEFWTRPGAVVSWRAQAPGASMVFGWFQLPDRAGEVRRRLVLSAGEPQGGVQLDLRDADGAPVRADGVRVWRAGCPGPLRLPWLQSGSARDDRLRVGADQRVPLPEGYWDLEVFADHACLHPCIVEAYVPHAGGWVTVGAVARAGARVAVRLVWSTEQVGPDEGTASGVCGSALRWFGVRWLVEDGVDHTLDLRDASGNRIDVWSAHAAQLDAVASAVLPTSAGRLVVKAGLYEPVEVAGALQVGWNHFVLRLDRRGRPFAIERSGR